MKKTFIKVTGTWQTKNGLQKAILESLQELDHTLADNQGTAFKLIELAFNDIVKNYEGKAKKPEFKRWESNPKTSCFMVDDVIKLSVYDVVNDLTKVK